MGTAGKKIRYRLEWLALKSATKFLPLLSRKACHRLALLLGLLGAMLDRRGRRVALSNLRVAFGDEISSERRAQIVRESYEHFARTMLDFFWSPRLTSQNFSRYVEFENSKDYVAGSSRTTMSGCSQRKLRLFFAHSPPPREASQIDDPSKDRWRNVMFPLDI